jgi:UDP-2,3-diacylglucosamine hydrolase
MTGPALLISDLHLPPGPSPYRTTFVTFLNTRAREAQVLYILGDLFEVWIGDDAGLQQYREETSALRELTEAGVPVYFMRGNRDFLVGRTFCEKTGCQLLPDPCKASLAGVPTLLSHGDQFCASDVGYQRWRKFAHNPVAQWIFLRLPRRQRAAIAGQVRARSKGHTRLKAEDIMDVDAAAVTEAFRQHGVSRIIHGHTHRPAEHRHDVSGHACTRWVLCDWRPDRCEALQVDENGIQRILLA